MDNQSDLIFMLSIAGNKLRQDARYRGAYNIPAQTALEQEII